MVNLYEPKEDLAILQEIIDRKAAHNVRGKLLWYELEKLDKFESRSWQSLRSRYLRTIIPQIHRYKLNVENEQYIMEGFNESAQIKENKDTLNSNKPKDAEFAEHRKHLYSRTEDLKILSAIVKLRAFYCLKGITFWKNLELEGTIEGRSWQSLKDRFIKYIYKNLPCYDLDMKNLQKIRRGYEGVAFKNMDKYLTDSDEDK